MECNKDEALRAKEIAEKKFVVKDLAAAKKFALKAQNLFPSLEGIDQFIATLDVHLSSPASFNGEKDWYAIFSVDPKADDETVKKQYRKLALQLHPDKNKSVGAEGAFQLISEAWSVLSDKSKRMLYDHKRFGKVAFQPKTAPMKKDHSVPNTSNGFHTSGINKPAPSKVRPQKKNTEAARTSFSSNPPSSQPLPKVGTFWTSCLRCKMQYEYLRVYLNFQLLCPNCHESFVASENGVGVSSNGSNISAPKSFPQHQQQNSNLNTSTNNSSTGVGPDFNSSSNFQWGPFSRTSASSTAAAQAANVVHNTYEKVRREHEEAQAASKREEALSRSGLKRNLSDSVNSGQDGKHVKKRRDMNNDPRFNYGGREMRNTGVGFDYFSNISLTSRKFIIRRGFPQVIISDALARKVKAEVHKKVEEHTSAKAAKSAEKEKAKKKQKPKEIVKEEKVKEAVRVNATDQDRVDEPRSNSKHAPFKKESPCFQDVDSENEAIEPVSIDVPDPDFHDFDKDRTERSFHGDEVWATYDDEDGMPRYYAFVQKVISYKPFKVRMSFLASKSNSEFGPLNWVASGFAKTSGDFRVGRYEVKDTLNIFSHKVRWEKVRGVFKILPRKGEIWAIYRNWSPDWNEHTPDDLIYKYDMVEVLDDYNEEQGVSVAPLIKVAGFKTVFRRNLDSTKVIRVPKEEMFRFSHQVPSYVLTGEEGPNAPKGCYELDPAATPLELLQIVTEDKD